MRVVAVSSNDPKRRTQAREAWGEPLCIHEDPLDLLENPEIAVVIIATPNHTHPALAVAALNQGTHVTTISAAGERSFETGVPISFG